MEHLIEKYETEITRLTGASKNKGNGGIAAEQKNTRIKTLITAYETFVSELSELNDKEMPKEKNIFKHCFLKISGIISGISVGMAAIVILIYLVEALVNVLGSLVGMM